MDRNTKVLGFLGLDKYEYVLYLSRVLVNLQKRVLLIDCSENGALALSIPRPNGMEGKLVEYRGVMFNDMRGRVDELSQEQWDEYDAVLIDFGYAGSEEQHKLCDHLFYVTDQYAHHLLPLIKYQYSDMPKSLVFKDVFSRQAGPKYMVGEFEDKGITFDQVYVVYQDEMDLKYRLECQYNHVFSFKKLSMPAKILVKGMAGMILPDITVKDINGAFKKAQKGV